MRFLLKIGLLLLAVSYFLPAPPEGAVAEDRPGLSPVVMLYGLQQAVTDVAGFCTRSPAACASARDALGYAAERMAAAAASVTALATGAATPPPAASAASAPERPTPAASHAYPPPTGYRAPLVTGAIRRPAPAEAAAPVPAPRPAPRPAAAEPFRMPAVAEGGFVSGPPRPASELPGGASAARRPAPAG